MQHIKFSQECVSFEKLNLVCFHAYTSKDLIICLVTKEYLNSLDNSKSSMAVKFYNYQNKIHKIAEHMINTNQFDNADNNMITIG